MKLYQAPILAAFGLTLCLAQPALAQIAKTAMGSVEATIGDSAYSGETLDVPSEGTSTAEIRSFGPVTSIQIQAHDPESESIMRNVLTIEVSLMGSDASASIMETTISWWPEGMSPPYYLGDDNGTAPEVVFDRLSLEDGGSAQGRFSAVLCRRDSLLAEADTSDCLPVEGTFDTALRKAETDY
ncbi:hypothetical protein DTW92_02525 [Paracoccus pantotrophus]|uniref:hypothetical protein n=1 Tax=Paracoccus pantotrophus TaxID=82367 RepID=UPI000E0991DB|nr:hypothetical protein [Paracoccus pantotrophus]RDD99789.1 hypothetical protein DTW92_02525 [Paracoccus pantotrophus]WGR65391.1 hypothetical protein E3U24_09000 [Paracoccus pantotrophus]